MIYPSVPTCHANEMQLPGHAPGWREPKPFDAGPNTHLIHHARNCYYCGSVHPEELLKLLANGATLEEADRKYGFIHKFYVHASNPNKGAVTQVGSSSDGQGNSTPIMGTEGDLWGKFYTIHLRDEGYDAEAKAAVLAALTEHTRYEWLEDEKGVSHRGKTQPAEDAAASDG